LWNGRKSQRQLYDQVYDLQPFVKQGPGLMDGMYSTEEIKGSISILLVLWMGCTLQRRLKVVFLYCWPLFHKRSEIVRFPTTYQLCLRPFHKTCRNVFTISDFRLVVMMSSLCGGTKIDQFTRAAHLSDKFIYSFKQNIKC
jgi:hypothetical protein